jgi:hypothetical protein
MINREEGGGPLRYRPALRSKRASKLARSSLRLFVRYPLNGALPRNAPLGAPPPNPRRGALIPPDPPQGGPLPNL